MTVVHGDRELTVLIGALASGEQLLLPMTIGCKTSVADCKSIGGHLRRRDFPVKNETELAEGRRGCRAPINGVIVGAITGAVLALVLVLEVDDRLYRVAPGMVVIYAVAG